MLEPDTINSLHAYHQEQVYPLKQFVDEARYCVFMGRERIGPTVHFVLFSIGRSSMGLGNVSICMEHFDSNAKEYLQAHGHANLPDLEDQVTACSSGWPTARYSALILNCPILSCGTRGTAFTTFA